jgi:hypothetical protein
MSETEATAIDEKKAEDSGSTTDKADWKAFTKNFSHGLITGIFLGVVVIGSTGLFLAKVANANILPTTCDIEPYPSDKEIEDLVKARDVAMDIIYMNPVKILPLYGLKFWENLTAENYFIQEANFVNGDAKLNFMNDFKNSWLCDLKDKAYPKKDKVELGDALKMPEKSDPLTKANMNKLPQNSPFWLYEFKTLKLMTCNSFSIINKIFFYMNYLPEWLTMLVFALFFSVIIMLIYIVNMIYGFWAHFLNFGEMIKNLYNPKDFNSTIPDYFDEDNGKKWYQKWSTITYPLYVIAYFIAASYSALLISPGLVTFYAFFKALGANYVVRDENYSGEAEKAPKLNIFSFIKSALYYKKTFLIILVMINLMGVTNEYLGTSYLPGVIIALVILVFGLKVLETNIPIELFGVINPIFPPLSQPKVNLKTEQKVDICKEEDTIINPIAGEIKKSVTGFEGSNVLQNTKIGTMAGGRSIKMTKSATNTNTNSNSNSNTKSATNTKIKQKIYNLKLV